MYDPNMTFAIARTRVEDFERELAHPGSQAARSLRRRRSLERRAARRRFVTRTFQAVRRPEAGQVPTGAA